MSAICSKRIHAGPLNHTDETERKKAMKRWTRIASLMVSMSMLCSGGIVPAAFAEDAKYTTEVTASGWTKVTNDNGVVLGYTEGTGVTIIEDDGYAFKDLNQNGTLDAYEDWRLDADIRAQNLIDQMDVQEMLPLMLLKEYDMQYSKGSINSVTPELDAGMRALCTPFVVGSTKEFANYVNGIQAYVEGTLYGIPVEIDAETGLALSTEWPNHLTLGASFEPEQAAAYARMMSSEYRAMGISGMMAPQTDVASEPRWSRIEGTFGEDPLLSSDIVREYVNGLQSSYDAEGNDLGWGSDSIIVQVKHFPGDGAAEGGREAHSSTGCYNVYPGDNYEALLAPFKAALELPGLTGAAVGVMPSYSIAIDEDGEPYDDEPVASGFSKFKLTETLREEMGFEGVITSDFVITMDGGRTWGVSDLTVAERKLLSIDAGMDRFGGESDVEGMRAAYDLGVAQYGEDAMKERIAGSAFRLMRNVMRAGLFENAYSDLAEVKATVNTAESQAVAYQAFQKGVAMLKNSGNIIHEATSDEKPTVYIPMVYASGAWSFPVDRATADQYFNVVTDTVAETLTGPADANGNPTAAYEDIVHPSDEELAKCDYALPIVSNPSSSGYDSTTNEYIPISLQYGEYTANSQYVRTTSLAGDQIEVTIESPYGAQTVTETENRSYYGKTAQVSNAHALDAILYAAEHCAHTVVCVVATKPLCVYEFEDKVDAIVMSFNPSSSFTGSTTTPTRAMFDVVTGKYEPSALLPFQMPASMETVEAQYEDVPRDMECHVDTDGNTYDFAFGLNWSGVIKDERVEKYSAAPLSE